MVPDEGGPLVFYDMCDKVTRLAPSPRTTAHILAPLPAHLSASPLTRPCLEPHCGTSKGVFGSRGVPGDLLRCSCGRKIGILHFVGAVRNNPMLARINATVLATSGENLLAIARWRATRPEAHPSAAAAGGAAMPGSSHTRQHLHHDDSEWQRTAVHATGQ